MCRHQTPQAPPMPPANAPLKYQAHSRSIGLGAKDTSKTDQRSNGSPGVDKGEEAMSHMHAEYCKDQSAWS